MRTVPLPTELASMPFPNVAAEEFTITAPDPNTMSSVPAVASPAFRPGFAVLVAGSVSVIVTAEPGRIDSRCTDTVTAPPGSCTV